MVYNSFLYFITLVLSLPNIWPVGASLWCLYLFYMSPSCFEHFLTFLHKKILQAHSVLVPVLESARSFEDYWFEQHFQPSYGTSITETGIQSLVRESGSAQMLTLEQSLKRLYGKNRVNRKQTVNCSSTSNHLIPSN